MTMTYDELMAEARRLSSAQRRRLAREVLASLHEDRGESRAAGNDENDAYGTEETWKEERAQYLATVPPDSSLHHVLGALRTSGYVPMSKAEVREEITDYLMRKYMG